MRSFRF